MDFFPGFFPTHDTVVEAAEGRSTFLDPKTSTSTTFLLVRIIENQIFPWTQDAGIIWVWPLSSNSDHQDYSIFSIGNPYKFTVTGKGPHPR